MKRSKESPSHDLIRSSCPEVFFKKGVLRNFTKFTDKHLCQSLFFNKVAGFRTPLVVASVLRFSSFSEFEQLEADLSKSNKAENINKSHKSSKKGWIAILVVFFFKHLFHWRFVNKDITHTF